MGIWDDTTEIIFSPRHIVLNDHLSPDPPPKKKRPFFGGYVFLRLVRQFLSVLHKKNFGKTWGLSRSFGHISADSRPIAAENQNLKFQKYEIFAIFEQFLDFFFQMSKC